ncbi:MULTISPECIES: class I SAM-dependent methyltransferase [Frankia]|nr:MULTISPECIES: methyltransferase domain-containing protein [Frankia]
MADHVTAGDVTAGDVTAGDVTGGDLRQAAIWHGLWAVLPRPAQPAPADQPAGAGTGAPGEPGVGARRPLVVDAGGGSGGFAVPIAAAGYPVIVVDPSPDALAALHRRVAERGLGGRVTSMQGDLRDLTGLVGTGQADLLLCHSVLDVVDDPQTALAQALGVLRPGGALSVVVAGLAAAVLARALAGQFEAALAALVEDAPPVHRPSGADHGSSELRESAAGRAPRRFSTAEAVALVRAAGAEVLEVHGVRIFADLVPGERLPDALAARRLLRLELAAAGREPFRALAAQLHVLARSPGGTGPHER